MVAVVATIAGFIAVHAIKREAAAQHDADTPIRMVNPRFFGRDSAGRAYVLAARQATREAQSFQTVLLDEPRIDLDVGGVHPSAIASDTGIYHEDSRILVLRGHVTADKASQGRFATDEAVIDTRTGTVRGPATLAGRTALGEVRSHGFDVTNKGDRVVFRGGVHARLNPH